MSQHTAPESERAEAHPSALDRLIPTPRLVEVEGVDLALDAERLWALARYGDLLGRTPFVRALFALRTLPSRLRGDASEPRSFDLDELRSSPERPGFQVLLEEPGREVAVGAIGQVWHAEIPFVHVGDADEFAAYAEGSQVKVAWSLRVIPQGEQRARLEVEVRVDANDESAWTAFKRYFLVIGPGSRFIRRTTLASLAREYGAAEHDERRPLPGDELLPDAQAQVTDEITIRAPADAVWPWLVQMGVGRAGFYSLDTLDNDGASARELHPEWSSVTVGQVLPAAPGSTEGFEVLRVEASRELILGGLYDVEAGRQCRFDAPRPARFWQVTWAFALESIDATTTRLRVRARAAFSGEAGARLHVAWIRPVHHLMERVQLENLKLRAEGRLPVDGWRDVAAGVGGAAIMALAWLTPFLRPARSHWGVSAEVAGRILPGDERVPEAQWSWTHGIELDATPDEVWPWVAQLGADRGGFYSYQWLENLAGCEVRNAERIHDEWQTRLGSELSLHPKAPPLRVVEVDPPRCFIAEGEPDPEAIAKNEPWAHATWAFVLEPLGDSRCRLISRFRTSCSDDLPTRLMQGPSFVEPVGFAMDRRMLLGIKERVDRARAERKAS